MSFLPTDYESPKSSGGYMKIQDGENKIRILSKPIMGWEDWQDGKPVRFRMEDRPLTSIDPKKPIKHFWSVIVWNHIAEQIQIFNITQSSVRKSIEDLCRDEVWGEPFGYDIKIVRSGEGMKTKYVVNPAPHKPIGDYVREMFYEKRINLDALFDNQDPFDPNWSKYTDGIFDAKEEPKKEEIKPLDTSIPRISKDQVFLLKQVLELADPKFVDKIKGAMKNLYKAERYEDIPQAAYDKILASSMKNRDEYQAANQELPF